MTLNKMADLADFIFPLYCAPDPQLHLLHLSQIFMGYPYGASYALTRHKTPTPIPHVNPVTLCSCKDVVYHGSTGRQLIAKC